MPRLNNEEIERILAFDAFTPENSWELSWKILELEKNASVADVQKKYRVLSLQLHPDKNKDNCEKANSAFKILTTAKERAITGEKAAVAKGIPGFSAGGLFDPESGWMKGPQVRTMRDMMMSYAGFFNKNLDIEQGEPGKIRQYFEELQLENVADKKTLISYAKLLFPDVFLDSQTIAETFISKDLSDTIEILTLLSKRYPELKRKSTQCFENELNIMIEEFASLLPDVELKTPPEPFSSFIEFVENFLGLPRGELSSDESIGTINPDLAAGWAVFDVYAQNNSKLLRKLVAITSSMRSQPDIDEPFSYSDTTLEPDLDRAKLINKLCEMPDLGHAMTRKAVLEAQLRHFMHSMLGEQLPEHLMPPQRIPTTEIEIEYFFDNTNNQFRYRNLLTNEIFNSVQDVQLKCPWYTAPMRMWGDEGSNRPVLAILPTPRGEKRSLLGAFSEAKGLAVAFLDNYFGEEVSDFGACRLERPVTIVDTIRKVHYEKRILTAFLEPLNPAPVAGVDGEVAGIQLGTPGTTANIDIQDTTMANKIVQWNNDPANIPDRPIDKNKLAAINGAYARFEKKMQKLEKFFKEVSKTAPGLTPNDKTIQLNMQSVRQAYEEFNKSVVLDQRKHLGNLHTCLNTLDANANVLIDKHKSMGGWTLDQRKTLQKCLKYLTFGIGLLIVAIFSSAGYKGTFFAPTVRTDTRKKLDALKNQMQDIINLDEDKPPPSSTI